MTRLVNEAVPGFVGSDPNKVRRRSVTIREQILVQRSHLKQRGWWQRCYDSWCYHDTNAATYPALKFGRSSVQMTCPSCQNRIRSRLVYLKPNLRAGCLFFCVSPFISNCCKSIVHYCPACNVALGQTRNPPKYQHDTSFSV